jgi:hypothetical protein
MSPCELTLGVLVLAMSTITMTSCGQANCNATCESGASTMINLHVEPPTFSNASVVFCWNTFCASAAFGVVTDAGAGLSFSTPPGLGLDVTVEAADIAFPGDMGTLLEVDWFADDVADGDFYSLMISGSAGTLFQGSALATYVLEDACSGPGGECESAVLNLVN